MNIQNNFEIRPARVEDVPVILGLIRELATYERAPDEVTATEEQLTRQRLRACVTCRSRQNRL